MKYYVWIYEIFRVQKIIKGEEIEFSLGVKDEN